MNHPVRLRLTEPIALERDIHAAVHKMLLFRVMPPAVWVCYPAGHITLTPLQAAKLSQAGLASGMPDFLGWHAGRSYGLELKRPGQERALSGDRVRRTARGGLRLVIGQRRRFADLEAAGMALAVVTDQDEALAVLAGWGMPLRRAS